MITFCFPVDHRYNFVLQVNYCPYCGEAGVVLVSHMNTCTVAPSPSCPVLPGSDGDRAARAAREEERAHTSTEEQSLHQNSQVDS